MIGKERRGAEGKDKPAFALNPLQVSLPKSGGAVRGIGKKFAANPGMGTGTTCLPISLSPDRGEFGPQIAHSYNSGEGQGASSWKPIR